MSRRCDNLTPGKARGRVVLSSIEVDLESGSEEAVVSSCKTSSLKSSKEATVGIDYFGRRSPKSQYREDAVKGQALFAR